MLTNKTKSKPKSIKMMFCYTRPKPAYGRQGLDWDRWARIQFSQVHFGAKLDSTDLLWCKNVTSPTGGSNRPFRCLEERGGGPCPNFWHLSRMFPKNILDMISSSTNTLEAFEKLQYWCNLFSNQLRTYQYKGQLCSHFQIFTIREQKWDSADENVGGSGSG